MVQSELPSGGNRWGRLLRPAARVISIPIFSGRPRNDEFAVVRPFQPTECRHCGACRKGKWERKTSLGRPKQSHGEPISEYDIVKKYFIR